MPEAGSPGKNWNGIQHFRNGKCKAANKYSGENFVVLTLNSLVIISTMYTPDGVLANGYMGAVVDTIGKANLAQTAFGTVFFGKRNLPVAANRKVLSEPFPAAFTHLKKTTDR